MTFELYGKKTDGFDGDLSVYDYLGTRMYCYQNFPYTSVYDPTGLIVVMTNLLNIPDIEDYAVLRLHNRDDCLDDDWFYSPTSGRAGRIKAQQEELIF